MGKTQKTHKSPQGKMVEIDGILYLLIDGKLYRYANLTLDKGFKITLGRPGSEEESKRRLIGGIKKIGTTTTSPYMWSVF